MVRYILFVLLSCNILYGMENKIAGQLEPDKDLVFSRDVRTRTKIVSVKSYNVETLEHYAKNTKLARIVSFDGGGIRGIGAASWCANLEHATQKSMADMFNLFAGTSTGGIIATGLTLENPVDEGKSLYSGEDIVDFYIKEGKKIFTPRSFWGYLTTSKYKTRPAYACFDKVFKNTRLSEIRSDCDLLVTYYNLTNNRPAFFKSHKAKDPINSRVEDYYLKDVIASTTAAPTFFKEFKLYTSFSKDHPEIHCNNFISAIDGGVATNDPSNCALTEAMSVYHYADAFFLISMGTGRCVTEANPQGLISWANNISDILMKNTSEMSNHMIKKFGEYLSKPVFFSRFQFDISEAHRAMDNKSPENMSYLIHQAQNTTSVRDKIKKISKVLKYSDKPDKDSLIGDKRVLKSSFMEI